MSFPRASGILLHPTSLPSRGGIGDFGPSAYAFADFLASARQGLWQVLPLGPLGFGDSPYSSTSAFAGNPLLISLERLADRGWIDRAQIDALADGVEPVDYPAVFRQKLPLLFEAAQQLRALRCAERPRALRNFLPARTNGGSMTSFSSMVCARVSSWKAGTAGPANWLIANRRRSRKRTRKCSKISMSAASCSFFSSSSGRRFEPIARNVRFASWATLRSL